MENNFYVMNLVEKFIKETNYKLKITDREVEVNDMFCVDRETGDITNYGQINDIIYSKEFERWFKLRMEEGDKNGVSDI